MSNPVVLRQARDAELQAIALLQRLCNGRTFSVASEIRVIDALKQSTQSLNAELAKITKSL